MERVQRNVRLPLFFFVTSLLVTYSLHSQSASPQTAGLEKLDLSIVEKIRDEGLNRSHIPEDARYLMDVIGPRLTGSPAMKRANEWTAQKMREYGLENVHLEPWEFGRGWQEISYFGRMTEPFIRPLSGRSLAWTGSTKGLQSGPAVIVKARSVADLDLPKDVRNLKGAWILVNEAGEPRNPSFDPVPLRRSLEELLAPPDSSQQKPVGPTEEERRRDIEEFQHYLGFQIKLRESGALGILRRSSRMDGIIRGSSILGDAVGSLINPGGPETLPNIMLADEDYSLIYRNAASGIPVTLEFNIQNRFPVDDMMAYNTIGETQGTDKRHEVVILGAHLDSWHMGTGGTDNGAGSMVTLEVMRILKTIGVQPRRTIRIALWSGEEPELPERDLLGSSAYVETHKDELNKISVYLNLDRGSGRIRGIYSQMNPFAIPIFEQLFRPFRDLGVVAVRDENSGGSDHVTFDRVGVPSFYFIQDLMEREKNEQARKMHHTNIDTYDALILDDLKQAAVVVGSTVYHLAMRDEMFPRKAKAGVGR